MKKLLLLLLICLCVQQMRAQDPELLNNVWHLTSVNIDGVDNFPPPYNDYVTGIALRFDVGGTDFSFDTSVCNVLTATASYNASESFELSDITQSLGGCMGFYDINYELTYFGFYFDNFASPFTYEINDQGSNALQLIITGANGDYAEYGNPALGIPEELKSQISLFPNPVSETLFITAEGTSIEQISVFSISGQRILYEISATNQMDVSGIKTGLYFAEITTSEGKSIQKFIKK